MSTEAKAILRSARISAQKARLVADLVRGMPVGRASDVLQFTNKKAAHLVRKVLLSAVANAENNLGADIDELKKQKKKKQKKQPTKNRLGITKNKKTKKNTNKGEYAQYLAADLKVRE